MSTINKIFNNSHDEKLAAILDSQKFPFKCVPSLAPLIDFWNQMVSGNQTFRATLAGKIQEELIKVPELSGPLEDLSILSKHKELVDVLMSVIFPPSSWDQDCSAAFIPFHLRSIYATPSFERFLLSREGTFKGRPNLGEQVYSSGKLLIAYIHVAKKFYDLSLKFEYPLIHTVKDPETNLDLYYRLIYDPRFVDIKQVGAIKPLTDEEKKYLLANPNDLKTWMELIPPENFEFHGFVVGRAVDVTDQEVLSSLKRDLIEKESIVSTTLFQSLQEKLRTLLRLPKLVLSLAAIQGDQVLLVNYGCKLKKSCIYADSQHYKTSDFAGSIYERSVKEKNFLIIEDLMTYPRRSFIEDQIVQQGIRNILVAPLFYQDRLIGTLDLGSPNPGELNVMNVMKLQEVLPLFSMAINRSMEELDNRIQAFIKKQYTAIHPSVDWRFRKAVFNTMEKYNRGIFSELEPIVFNEVYPLFGVSDIRGSSTQRNAAIQADLIDHLILARNIIVSARDYRPLPFLDELAYRINKNIANLKTGLGSGDEMTILDFLHRDVEPFFPTIMEFGSGMPEKIQIYRDTIDAHLGVLYRKRKDFEDSVTRINETISFYLDEEEERAQAMFPHYFEKHKTDGVDHSIYVGASLVEDGKFDMLYLKNLRLWQLLMMCGVARRTDQLKASLKVPLDTTHLILVQNTPLSIRFRIDEKQFDVDGAYNIRYEIMKKRIDKAMIKGRNERLTQPRKIAIVYSQPREAAEYRQYIDYLHASGYLTNEVEDLELEELQGIQGLKALRVTANLQTPKLERSPELEEMEDIVKKMAPVST
jgi:hypothetical protein